MQYAKEHNMTTSQKQVKTYDDLPKTAVIKIAVLCSISFYHDTNSERDKLVHKVISAAQSVFDKKGLGTRILIEVNGKYFVLNQSTH